MRPLISVIVPVYNVEAYLCFCLDSVLSQTLQDFEVICIDDASSDSSYKILSEYAHKDSRIHVLRNGQNKGLSYTRNVGLDAAKGTYIYFLDSDDTIVPECLEKACHAAEENAADFVMFGAKLLQDGRQRTYVSFTQQICDKVWNGRELFTVLQNSPAGIFSCVQFKLWRSAFLLQFGLRFYEEIYYEDLLFNFSTMMYAKKIVCIPDLLYHYCRRCNSIIMQKKDFKHIYSYLISIDEIKNIFFRTENTFFPEERKAFFDYIVILCQHAMSMMSSFGLEKLPDDSNLFDSSKRDLFFFLRAMASRKFGGSFSQGEVDYLKCFKYIIVYGAGKKAKKVLPELLKNDIENFDIVVTSKNGCQETLYGFPIKEIGSIDYPKEKCVVIVAVGTKLEQEIQENVKKLGYENVLSF